MTKILKELYKEIVYLIIIKDGNEYSNILLFVFLTNIRMRFRIRIFIFFHVHIFHSSFGFLPKICIHSRGPFLSVKVGMYHPCKLRCQFDTLLF